MKYDVANSTGVLLARASQLMRLGLNRKFSSAGCLATAEQWKVLIALWQADGLTQQELTERVFKSKASMTKLIDGLEQRELVLRKSDPTDRRSKRIYLSVKGMTELESLMVLAKQNLVQAEKGISEGELEVFKKVLKQVICNMEENHDEK
ncbi:MarR family transcriptional regulator [Halodesulfovibrio sp.]|uniref:MarR family winged helix-turn-helix transcriptional regulator n=1 Tax=Halodesulfovibrio sp. TaxID=1912772 RepID=UPI0025C71C92|nr:MarR family transcriptional regulator [Halodesulfovibrio sp.]